MTFVDRAAATVRDVLADLCAAGLATVTGPREVDGILWIDVEPARPGAASMHVELDDDPSLALYLGDDRLYVELYGPEQQMLDSLRELVAGVARHGYEAWIRERSDDGVAGLACIRTPDGRRRTISNNVAPWAGLLRRPRGEPRRYVPYAAGTE